MQLFPHSIQWRIFSYYTVLISLAVGGLIAIFYVFEKQTEEKVVQVQLLHRAVTTVPHFFSPSSKSGGQSAKSTPYGDYAEPVGPGPPRGILQDNVDLPPPGDRQTSETRQDQASAQTANSQADLTQYPSPRPQPPASEEALRQRENEREEFFGDFREYGLFLDVVYYDDSETIRTENFPADLEDWIEQVEPARFAFKSLHGHLVIVHFDPDQGALILGLAQSEIDARIYAVLRRAIAIGLLAIVATSALGFALIRISLKPIQRISQTAQRIADGNISGQIETSSIQSELEGLVTVLNNTFSQLGRALKRQIQFTSDASHELRTPVAAILAECQYSLKRERTSERYRETIEVCHESAQHMRALISDLRELAKFDEQAETLKQELTDMEPFLGNIASVVEPLATDNGLSFRVSFEPAALSIDEKRMRQAILNLLGNAIRYTQKGGKIAFTSRTVDVAVVIEVKDTGFGIPPEKLPYIFDRFYRVDEARNVDSGGAGLGLSIARSIVEAHGGTITVRSIVGVGSTFRIKLPRT